MGLDIKATRYYSLSQITVFLAFLTNSNENTHIRQRGTVNVRINYFEKIKLYTRIDMG